MTTSPPYSVAQSKALGRHLVAARDIQPGQVVVAQDPYVAVLYDEQVPARCDYCFKTAQQGATLLRCSRSRHARYCSREHQAAAWQAGYKWECQALVAHAPRVPPPTIRLAARALWRKLSCKPGEEQEHSSWDAVQALLSHWGSLDDDRKVTFAQMAVLAREFADSGLGAAAAGEPDLPAVKDVAQLLARMACNNHTICDEDLRPVGVGLYPLGALLNHSCTPNCMQSFGPRGRIEFRALTKIPAGEPLTISYVELAATRQERREELAGTYRFDIARAGPLQGAAAPSTQQGVPSVQDMEVDGGVRVAANAGGGGSGGRMQQAGQVSGSGAADGPWRFSRSALRGTEPILQVDLPLPGIGPAASQGAAKALAVPAAKRQVTLPALGQASCTVGADQGSLQDDQHLVRLLVYEGTGDDKALPPWPCDERDGALTGVVQSSAGRGRVKQGTVTTAAAEVVLGGLHARLVSKLQGAKGQAAVGTFELDAEEGDGKQEEGEGEAGKVVVEVECWGPWAVQAAAALPAGGQTQTAGDLETIDEGMGVEGEAGGLAVWLAADAAAPLRGLVERVGAALQLQAAAERHGSNGDPEQSAEALQRALCLIDASDTAGERGGAEGHQGLVLGLGPAHVLRLRLQAALLKVLVELGSWRRALEVAQVLTPMYELVYPSVWPNLGLHYATLAKLELLHDDAQTAFGYARKALEILRVTHRPSAGLGCAGPSVLEQVEMTLMEAQACLQGGAQAGKD